MEKLLQTVGLTKKFPDHIAVNNVDLTINKGDIYGLIGKNGAGKTTLMKIILGMSHATSGEYVYPEEKNDPDFKKKIGSIIEAPALYKNCTAYENMKRYSILFGGDDSQINSLLKYVGLEKVKNKRTEEFSLGMKQRLGIAIALLGEPKFLVLDEPVNGLDPSGIIEVRDLIQRLNKERGITFLISSHLLDELARVATKFGIIDNGFLVEEITTEELKERYKKCIMVYVDDMDKAMEVLSKLVDKKDLVREDDHIEILSGFERSAEYSKALFENGVMVKGLETKAETLEQYFVGKVGQ